MNKRLQIGGKGIPVAITLIAFLGWAKVSSSEWLPFMPASHDRTEVWWQDGFPGLVDGAPWRQCLLTGRFGMVLDTEKLKIPHLGEVSPGQGLFQLPAAELNLEVNVNGALYRVVSGGALTRHGGPRMVESGRFFQRSDVTDLVFQAENGAQLNVDARIEFSAWSDRLNWVLEAQPGMLPIQAGEVSFGKRGGGFGLAGSNHFEIAADAFSDSPEFTYSFWAFVPEDYQATEVLPWLLCRHRNELADGNVGVTIGPRGVAQARLNLGGGRDNAVSVSATRPLRIGYWNHLVLSYDGKSFRMYVNDHLEVEKEIGKSRTPSPASIAFGRRGDSSGSGYYFRGVIDEIRIVDRALSPREIRTLPSDQLVGFYSFRPDGVASDVRPREKWDSSSARIQIKQGEKVLVGEAKGTPGDEILSASLSIDPMAFSKIDESSTIHVAAKELGSGANRPVSYEREIGWHRINLDGVAPIPPEGQENPSNDAIERIWLDLANPTEERKMVRLQFEKTAGGMAQRVGFPITGVSAVLRDRDGNPVGIPVQLSKNWHNDPLAGKYSGQWFHGISQIPLPPETNLGLELTIAYGHWGGVPAASHAQLSLIGWGRNQRWDQSALGSWGESICFEPDQIQGKATVTDVRPLMVTPLNGEGQWGWTNNVGGADFFRLYDKEGERQFHRGMRAEYRQQGPCLTEVIYSGKVGKGMRHSIHAGLARTDDLVRGTYRVRLDVSESSEFSRFVFFQVGADSYNMTREARFAVGDDSGLVEEWETSKDGLGNRGTPRVLSGAGGWASLHEGANPKPDGKGAWANRGIVIRHWDAKLGGKRVPPYGIEHQSDSSWAAGPTLDIVPPPGVTALLPGDYVEAVFEHLVIPQSAGDYYGSNIRFREALAEMGNTWRMVHREATENSRRVKMKAGALQGRYPEVRISTQGGSAEFEIEGGLGFVPLTFLGLSRSSGFELRVDGVVVDQAKHGSDFWQTDFDPKTSTWSHTYTVPFEMGVRSVKFGPASNP